MKCAQSQNEKFAEADQAHFRPIQDDAFAFFSYESSQCTYNHLYHPRTDGGLKNFGQSIHHPLWGSYSACHVHHILDLDFPHIHHTPNALAVVHVVEGLVDAAEVLSVRDELVNLERAVHVIVDEAAHLRAALDTAVGAAFPHAAGDELECYE